MPSAWIIASDTGEVRVAGSHSIVYDLLADPRFGDSDRTKVALVLKEKLQAALETVHIVRDLPDDEPYK